MFFVASHLAEIPIKLKYEFHDFVCIVKRRIDQDGFLGKHSTDNGWVHLLMSNKRNTLQEFCVFPEVLYSCNTVAGTKQQKTKSFRKRL